MSKVLFQHRVRDKQECIDSGYMNDAEFLEYTGITASAMRQLELNHKRTEKPCYVMNDEGQLIQVGVAQVIDLRTPEYHSYLTVRRRSGPKWSLPYPPRKVKV